MKLKNIIYGMMCVVTLGSCFFNIAEPAEIYSAGDSLTLHVGHPI